ncbi:MAG: hypothetical protein HOP15_13260 [Planctomycetes bacterium]|nr:hypothetical protein [Planctomycetota bacterium]
MLLALALTFATGFVAPQQAKSAESWADDALHLVAEIERLHPKPFFGCPQADFEAGVDAFFGSIEGASEPRALVELMRLVALLSQKGRDGHTGVWPLKARYLPLRAYGFADGWFVVEADPEQGEWIGAELVSVAGVPVGEACKRLAPLLTSDNEWNLRLKLGQALACADVLVGAELGTDPARARIELVRDGKRSALELACRERHLHDLWGGFNLPTRAGVTWLEGREQAYRLQVLEPERALYVQFNEVTARAGDGKLLTDFAAELVRTFEERKLAKVIVDVRSNRGGDNTTFGPLIAALQTPSINRPGVLFGLIGRDTFSAAGNFVTVLERDTKAILVGEPTGGAPNQYGDAKPVPLPNHPDVMVQVSTRYHQFGAPGDERLTHEPHLAVPLRSSAFFAGQDPVLRAALDYQPPR